MLLSSYGSNLALGFQGTPDFIERCFNWAVNTGVVGRGARLSWFQGIEAGKLAYICPQGLKSIEKGLYLQHRAEIIMTREFPLVADHTRNDEYVGHPNRLIQYDRRVSTLAKERTAAFVRDCIIHDAFLAKRPESIGHVYGLGSHSRAESEDFA